MRQWLLGILYAAVISSVALTVTPGGRVKNVTRMCCGLLCALALAGPLLELDMEQLAVSISVYGQAAQSVVKNAEEETKTMERTYIEEKCAAYILGKATEAGAAVSGAAVTARWDAETGVWYPWSASVTGTWSSKLASVIEAELGIPVQRQSWEESNHE